MRALTILLGTLLLLTLLCLYQVSNQKRESFESAAPDEDSDAMVFSAYMKVHGVPPTPSVASHYIDIVRTESLDGESIEKRIRVDADNDGKRESKEERSDTANGANPGATDDDRVRAVRDKVKLLEKMSEPVMSSPKVAEMARTKLRSIASQVSDLAAALEENEPEPKPEPRGIEQFMSFR